MYYPVPRYVVKIAGDDGITLRQLCTTSGVPCRASGDGTERQVELVLDSEPFIQAQPGGWGPVSIGVPSRFSRSPRAAARYALGAMAYGLFDGVARESIKNEPWSKVEVLGRRKSSGGRAMTPAERQRKQRAAQMSAS